MSSCPICGQNVPPDRLSEHVNACLDSQEQPPPAPPPRAAPRRAPPLAAAGSSLDSSIDLISSSDEDEKPGDALSLSDDDDLDLDLDLDPGPASAGAPKPAARKRPPAVKRRQPEPAALKPEPEFPASRSYSPDQKQQCPVCGETIFVAVAAMGATQSPQEASQQRLQYHLLQECPVAQEAGADPQVLAELLMAAGVSGPVSSSAASPAVGSASSASAAASASFSSPPQLPEASSFDDAIRLPAPGQALCEEAAAIRTQIMQLDLLLDRLHRRRDRLFADLHRFLPPDSRGGGGGLRVDDAAGARLAAELAASASAPAPAVSSRQSRAGNVRSSNQPKAGSSSSGSRSRSSGGAPAPMGHPPFRGIDNDNPGHNDNALAFRLQDLWERINDPQLRQHPVPAHPFAAPGEAGAVAHAANAAPMFQAHAVDGLGDDFASDGLDSDHDSGESDDLNSHDGRGGRRAPRRRKGAQPAANKRQPQQPGQQQQEEELTALQAKRYEQLRAFIRSDDDLYVQVLLYQAIDLRRLHSVLQLAGIKVGLQALREFLEFEGISFVLGNANRAALTQGDGDGEDAPAKPRRRGAAGAAYGNYRNYRGRGRRA